MSPPREAGTSSPLNDARTNAQSVRARTYVVIGALLVLLIAAVNIASLIVVRIGARHREFAVRLAVGASRFRVFRAVATEITIVTLAGLAAALLLATWARDAVARSLPPGLATPANDYGQLASFADLTLDVPVFAVVASIALATMVLVTGPRLPPGAAVRSRAGTATRWCQGRRGSGSGTTRAPRRSDGAGDRIC